MTDGQRIGGNDEAAQLTQVQATLRQGRGAYRAAAEAGDGAALVAAWRDAFDRARQIGGLAIDGSAAKTVQAGHAAAARRVELDQALDDEGKRRAELALAREKLLSLNVLDPMRWVSSVLIVEEEAVERAQAVRLQAERQASDAARGATQARADAAALAARATRSSPTQQALEAALERIEDDRGPFFSALTEGVTHAEATRQAAERAYAASQKAATALALALTATRSEIERINPLDEQRYKLESQLIPPLERTVSEAQDLTTEIAHWVGETAHAVRDATARRDKCLAQTDSFLDRWLTALVPTLPHSRRS